MATRQETMRVGKGVAVLLALGLVYGIVSYYTRNRRNDALTEDATREQYDHENTDIARAAGAPTAGDLLAVFATGAYTYAMASNYNRVGRPPVVLVADGRADVVVERESLDDLVRLDRLPPRLR